MAIHFTCSSETPRLVFQANYYQELGAYKIALQNSLNVNSVDQSVQTQVHWKNWK